jgi:2-polyprenyl-3-methyl-5-hydroxy-6-metoxy-1,4-benzoquinol methylase
MKLSSQQLETLQFFDSIPLEWRARAADQRSKVNVIAQRNACVHRVHAEQPGIRNMLDVGCGTGELVFEMAAKNVEATGIDFAASMIQVCMERRNEILERRAHFRCCSIWEFGAEAECYDLISALGLIEYVTRQELSELLSTCRFALRSRGMLVLSSRNRLFNLVSLNDYTRLEMSLGTVGALLEEAVALGSSPDLLSALEAVPGDELAVHPRQPASWIGVGVRHQYTPATLARILQQSGFEVVAAYPVHYHAVPPSATAGLHGNYVEFSNRMFEAAPEDHRLLPSSSSFVVAARKV